MPSLSDYPAFGALGESIQAGFDRVKEDAIEANPSFEELINDLTLDEAVATGEFGRGIGDEGEDTLEVKLFVGLDNKERYLGEETRLGDFAPFANFAGDLQQFFNNEYTIPGPDEEWFADREFTVIPLENKQDGLVFFLQQKRPQEAVSITREQRLDLDGTDINRSTILSDEEREELGQLTDAEGISIAEYPQRERLANEVERLFEDAIEEEVEERGDQFDVQDYNLSRAIVMPQWGNGTAEKGEDTLNVILTVSKTGTQTPNLDDPFFFSRADRFANKVESGLVRNETYQEFFPDEEFTATASNLIEEDIISEVADTFPPRAFSLLEGAFLDAEEGDFIATPAPDPPEPEEPEEEPEEPEPQPTETKTIEEILADEFPEMPPELRSFAVTPDKIKVPITKDTKSVEPRAMYDFEKELLTPGKADTPIPNEIEEGIGHAKAIGAFGTDVSPGSFPRVGIYIKYQLFYEGPSFGLEIYRDLITYSAFMSSTYDGLFRVGGWSSFRQYLWRLREVEKEGGPELIRKVSDAKLQELGLSRQPELPDGTPAPWLEEREYYTVNENNTGHPAWRNPKKWLYED